MRTLLRIVGLAALVLLASPGAPRAASPGMMDVVVSAQRCSVDGWGEGGFALSATLPAADVRHVDLQTGMLLGVKTVDSGPEFALVIALRGTSGVVESGRAGRVAFSRGFGFVEMQGGAEAVDDQAYWFIAENGAFFISVAGRTFTGRGLDSTVTFAEVPAPAMGDTRLHEVGHWLSLARTDDAQGLGADLFVAAPLGAALEGLAEIAFDIDGGSSGETGHAHGHLDYLKKVGDPSTGPPRQRDISFEASGSVTFQFDDGQQAETGVSLNTVEPGTLQLDVLGASLRFPYRVLPLTNRAVLFQGPAR